MPVALEENIRRYWVDVSIQKEHEVLLEVMSQYYGKKDNIEIFLKELSHPYKNWQFIVKEAKPLSLDYFHLMKNHEKGPEAANIFVDAYINAIKNSRIEDVRIDAADNLILFIQKILQDSSENFYTVIERSFNLIIELEPDEFFLFVKSYYQINKLTKFFINNDILHPCLELAGQLFIRYYNETYMYWLNQEDPLLYLQNFLDETDNSHEFCRILEYITKDEIHTCKIKLDQIVKEHKINYLNLIKEFKDLPSYNDLLVCYKKIPGKLQKISKDEVLGKRMKLSFLFHIMTLKGLSILHADILDEINKTTQWLIYQQNIKDNIDIVTSSFLILKNQMQKLPNAALRCILNIGQVVYGTGKTRLIASFIDNLINLGFQSPDFKGVGDDWQLRVNSVHLQNIKTWLDLIEHEPGCSKKLISSLIIHLSLRGVLIKDTDLFPREITKLLNSYTAPVYNLIKQLARIFPSYFNEIGAEGKLREISTAMDEIYQREDVLVHFLRKQSHVESSNLTLKLTEAVFEYWLSQNKEVLKAHIPPNIYENIDPQDIYSLGMHKIIRNIFENENNKDIKILLYLSDERLDELVDGLKNVKEKDKNKAKYTVNFYKLLYKKYYLDFQDIDKYLNEYKVNCNKELYFKIDKLKDCLASGDTIEKVRCLLDFLEAIKEIIIEPDKKYEINEKIFHKRHFAFDIPSMYGAYHELKFDSLALSFRLESLLNVLLEEMVVNIDLELITRSTFFDIDRHLDLFARALKIDGIYSLEMQGQIKLLSQALQKWGFSFTQYIDIFKGMAQAVQHITNDNFHSVHDKNMSYIIDSIPKTQILSKYLPANECSFDNDQLKHHISEIFYREMISSCLGLKQLDMLISRILNNLYKQSARLSPGLSRDLLNYDAEKAITSLVNPRGIVSDVIHLGMKAYNLVKLKKFGIPVPPGFIITTEIYRCRDVIEEYKPAKKHFEDQLASEIKRLEGITGKKFGNPKNPLLLSVRSGSSVSQPGMLETFLNVGINEDVAAGIASNPEMEWFACDNYRRFIQHYGMSYGITRDDFDLLMANYKLKKDYRFKREFSGKQMHQLALMYKDLVLQNGIDFKEDPFEQLHMAISMIFDSWRSERARAFREIMGISDDWGTAVTIQSMVFGNINVDAGAGVSFTRSPLGGDESIQLWGDFTPGNQGEDIVAGLVKTHPITKQQAENENRQKSSALESLFPQIYNKIMDIAVYLVLRNKWNHQEIEFTFQGPSLKDFYVLQTRDMVILRKKSDVHFVKTEELKKNFLGHGIGVGGSAMTGRLVFTLNDIKKWRELEPETSLILVRNDTVPDDIREIYKADGLLTALGGSTSHAAVVAHRLGKTCVVGCTDLICSEKDAICHIKSFKVKSGEYISINGFEGSVYSGKMQIKKEKSSC